MSKECVLRLDWDYPYQWVNENIEWFESYIGFVLRHLVHRPRYEGIWLRASSTGNTHVFVYIESDYWCSPPNRYFLESMLGGDLARTWYNYHRYNALGVDVDILFQYKKKRSYRYVTIPWKVILGEV